MFVDGETQSQGVFYLVQRLVGSLPDYVDMEVSATLKKQISDILVDNTDPENRIKVTLNIYFIIIILLLKILIFIHPLSIEQQFHISNKA